MIKGVVVGEVWATRKIEIAEGNKMILVAELDSSGNETGKVIVAFDKLDAIRGDKVAVSFGSGARNVFQKGKNRHIMADAAVSMILESE